MLQQLMTDGVAASRFSEIQEPEVIIVAPTRELINQIFMEARKFAYGYFFVCRPPQLHVPSFHFKVLDIVEPDFSLSIFWC